MNTTIFRLRTAPGNLRSPWSLAAPYTHQSNAQSNFQLLMSLVAPYMYKEIKIQFCASTTESLSLYTCIALSFPDKDRSRQGDCLLQQAITRRSIIKLKEYYLMNLFIALSIISRPATSCSSVSTSGIRKRIALPLIAAS